MKTRESGMPDELYWDSFFNPACMAGKLDLVGDVGTVIEVGCGYAMFTLPVAREVVGPVIALDIELEMVELTAQKAAAVGLTNVRAEMRDVLADGTGTPDGAAGYVMLFNILHVEDPIGLLREAWRALAPGGTVGVIHWRSDVETPRGPPTAIRPTAEQCRAWGEEAGFEFVRYESLCCCSWHWGLVMRKS